MNYWNRKKTECEIYVVDLQNQTKTLKVKIDVTPEQIMKELNLDNAYLILDGIAVTPDGLKRYIRDGSTLYTCKIKDKG